jgi:cAMP-dependent protein kinase regulator
MSVSAEVFGKFNVEKVYKPPVYEKTQEQAQAIKNRMKGNFMFSSLNPKDSKAILDAIVHVVKAPGESVINEGDDGDNFYLVESGELTCTKYINKDDKEPTFLKTYVQGESFGELALLYNAPRAATIVAKTKAELWSLERGTFNTIIKTAVQKKREKYDDFLEKVEILKCCEKNERQKIGDAFKEEWFEEDDVIIKQGDNDDNSSFYMIIEGNCIATMVMQPGTPAVEVKAYKPGDYFGERALLKDLPRAANVIAKS